MGFEGRASAVVEGACPDIVEGRSKTMGASSIGGVSGQSCNVSSSNESAGSIESRTESIARCVRKVEGMFTMR